MSRLPGLAFRSGFHERNTIFAQTGDRPASFFCFYMDTDLQ